MFYLFGKKKPLTQLRIKGLKVVLPGIEPLYLIIDYQYFIFIFNTQCILK